MILDPPCTYTMQGLDGQQGIDGQRGLARQQGLDGPIQVRIVRSSLFMKLICVILWMFKFEPKPPSRLCVMPRDISVDNNPTPARTLGSIRKLRPSRFEPVRPGPGSKLTYSRFWMLAFVWDRFQPIWMSRLGDNLGRHSVAQCVRRTARNLRIWPRPWPNDDEAV